MEALNKLKEALEDTEMSFTERAERMVLIYHETSEVTMDMLKVWMLRLFNEYYRKETCEEKQYKLGDYSGRELADFLEKNYACTVTFHNK